MGATDTGQQYNALPLAPKTPIRVSSPTAPSFPCVKELDENEREHTKTGKRYRDEETTGYEFMKCPHDPNTAV